MVVMEGSQQVESQRTTVNVKWSGKIIKLQLDPQHFNSNELKTKLFEATDVPKEFQTFVVAGGKRFAPNQDFDLEAIATKKIMMVGEKPLISGTNDEIIKSELNEVSKQTLKRRDAPTIPPLKGLPNLQNTCYLNSVVQCLKNLPGFRKLLQLDPVNRELVAGTVFEKLQKLVSSLIYKDPFLETVSFTDFLRTNLKVFNQMTEHMVYMQQDASDFFTYLVNQLDNSYEMFDRKYPNLVRKYFQFEISSVMTNSENDKEAPKLTEETNFALNLHIMDTKHIIDSIADAMKDEMQRHSESLNKDCLYKKQMKFKRLPGYMCLSLSRFFYKEDVQVNAKILKSIEFPFTIDLYEHCTDELKAKLKEHRVALKDAEANVKNVNSCDYHLFNAELADDIGSSNTGIYEIKGIISHRGRASDEGHYMAWIKPPLSDTGLDNKDVWYKANDKEVTQVAQSAVSHLKGGSADSDIAYMIFLGPKEVPIPN